MAEIVARKAGVIAGLELAAASFKALDPQAKFSALVADGAKVAAGARIARIEGRTRALLVGGTGRPQFSHSFERGCEPDRGLRRSRRGHARPHRLHAQDHPGMRALQKYAVRAGGGVNHRFGLYDAVLVKDNHIAAPAGLPQALERLRAGAGHLVKVEVEVDTLAQLEEALQIPHRCRVARQYGSRHVAPGGRSDRRDRVPAEASGGVTLETVRKIAETGVDLISVGALTHSARKPRLSAGVAVTIATAR